MNEIEKLQADLDDIKDRYYQSLNKIEDLEYSYIKLKDEYKLLEEQYDDLLKNRGLYYYDNLV